jgi:signal transduction histidine kinase
MGERPGDGAGKRTVPDFLSLMSHELKQPLTAARGSAELLLEHSGSPDLTHGRQKMLLETITRNLDQLQALLDSLRIFSEVESGELELNLTMVTVDELFDDALEDFGAPRSGTSIVFDSQQDLAVHVDIVMFKQVLLNLIANAFKFSPDGSVITVTATKDDDEILFAVRNEGGGFAKSDAKRIFERGVRLQPGRRGMGLGLFVAKTIVDAHRGRIWADSSTSSGSAFHVAVPSAS